MAEPKIKESEYKDQFATAPVIPRRRKRDEVEVTTEKIGPFLCNPCYYRDKDKNFIFIDDYLNKWKTILLSCSHFMMDK